MRGGSSIRKSALLLLFAPIALALPCALQAQDLSDAPSPPNEQAAAPDQCAAPPQDTAAPLAVPFDATGVMFTLPPDAQPEAAPCPPPPPPPPPRPPAPDIFGLSAVPVGLNFAAKQGQAWENVSHASLEGQPGPWNELLQRPNLQGADNQLTAVNSWVNWHVRYTPGKAPNQWNQAATTLLSGSGDCADFAVAKMALLQQLGVVAEDMFLIVLRDESRSIDHAVLAVRRNGTMYVLDNQTDLVLPAERIHDYRPILSYNGPFAWVYGKRTSERTGADASLKR